MSITVHYKTANDRLSFDFVVDSAKQAFASVARLQELFEEPACGDCGSLNIHASVRDATKDGAVYTYYCLVCTGCGATLDFGQKKDGKSLFIKRKDNEGNPLGNRGWYHYRSS